MLRLMITGLTLWLALYACLGSAAPRRAVDPEYQPALVGVELTSRAVQPGDSFAVTLKFKNTGRKEASRAYRVFLHFEAPKRSCENIVIHADHEPTEPTTAWRPGDIIVDGPHLITVPPKTVQQDYFIHVGVYDFQGTGGRLLDEYAPIKLRVTQSATHSSKLFPAPLDPI